MPFYPDKYSMLFRLLNYEPTSYEDALMHVIRHDYANVISFRALLYKNVKITNLPALPLEKYPEFKGHVNEKSVKGLCRLNTIISAMKKDVDYYNRLVSLKESNHFDEKQHNIKMLSVKSALEREMSLAERVIGR
jgi:hypothetical protein